MTDLLRLHANSVTDPAILAHNTRMDGAPERKGFR
jgi:hypothetical protein